MGPSSWPPRPPLAVPFPHPVTRCCCFFFFLRATRGLSSARLLLPVPPPLACSVLQALPWCCGVLYLVLFFFLCPPFPAVHPALWFLLPACTHINTAQVIWSWLPLVLFPCPIALLGRGPWRSPAMPAGRPPLASLSSLPPLPSPLFYILPALLLLLSCSVCSLLVVPVPWLYLARSHAPQGLCPVLRPVGRLWRPPQITLQGDSPVVRPRRPAPHQFPDGWVGRPVRLNAGHRHAVSLRESMCTFAPLLAPCFPLLPRVPAPSVCPSLVFCLPFFFFGCPSCRALRCSRARCVCPLLLSVLPLSRRPVPPPTPVFPPIRRLSAGPACTSPTAPTASAVLSLLCATRVFYPCPSLSSLPFSLVAHLPLCFSFVPRLSPHLGRHGLTLRGGFTFGLDCCPARGLIRRWPLGFNNRNVPHAVRTSEL